MKKRILVIDGMFFANRTLFGMQAENETLTLDNEQEQHNLLSNMHNSMSTLMQSFNNDRHHLIHNVIMVQDFDSWRKRVTKYVPYYYQKINPVHVPVLGYKENRKDKKEKSQINWDNFYGVTHKFMDEIREKYPVLKVDGCEGDDLIMMLSKTFAKSDEYELLVFCTDGDLEQTVNDNCMIFKNIRSKDCPFGEFILSANKLHELMSYQNMNAEMKLMSSAVENNDVNTLLSLQLNSGAIVKREIGKGIRYAKPLQVALVKTICGDAKDNIFPILRKPKDDTRAKNSSVSENQLVKTMEMVMGKFSEKSCHEVINDPETRLEVFTTLRSTFKDDTYPLDKMEEHYQHNFRINVLTMKNLDPELVSNYKTEFMENILPRIKNVIDDALYTKDIKTTRDNTVDLFVSSAPTDII